MTLSLILAAWSSFPGECSVAGGPFEERRYCFSKCKFVCKKNFDQRHLLSRWSTRSSLINVDFMNNLDQVDNQQCNIYEPYLSSLPCLYRNHALLKTAHLTYLALSIPYSMTLFRGASLSRRAVFTNSLTHSQTKVQIKSKINTQPLHSL